MPCHKSATICNVAYFCATPSDLIFSSLLHLCFFLNFFCLLYNSFLIFLRFYLVYWKYNVPLQILKPMGVHGHKRVESPYIFRLGEVPFLSDFSFELGGVAGIPFKFTLRLVLLLVANCSSPCCSLYAKLLPGDVVGAPDS